MRLLRRLVTIICLIVVLYILSETNPTRSEYVEWINHKTVDESSSILEKGIFKLAGKSIFDMNTTQKDYVFFTVYKTDFSTTGMGVIQAVGVFNHFIEIQ